MRMFEDDEISSFLYPIPSYFTQSTVLHGPYLFVYSSREDICFFVGSHPPTQHWLSTLDSHRERHTMHLILLLFLSFTAHIAHACLRYTARFPWDDTLPVTASITDNGIQTCWLNMTYKQHYLRQQYKNRNRGREEGVGVGDDGSAEWEFEDWDFSCVEGEKEGRDAGGNVTVCFLRWIFGG